jgi:hypothetical protein
MRNGQNKRMRGRNRGGGGGGGGKGHNPLTKVYESNGPDVKIRGTASHVAEKYIQLARDAQTSGDPVSAESYYQHAEHYFRLIAAAQEQFRQNAPAYGNRPEGGNDMREGQTGNDSRDGATYDDDDGDEMIPGAGEQPQFGTRDPQPYIPRDAPFYGQNGEQPQPRHNNNHNNNNHSNNVQNGDDVDRLPSFITGGAPQQGQPQQQQQPAQGFDNGNGEQRGDRYGYRRRRHRRGGGGPREMAGNNGAQPDGGGDESAH